MALIDLTVEKPALKRTEVVESTDVAETTPPQEMGDTTSKSGGRLRRTAGVLGVLAVGVVGLVTVRKFRARRRTKNTNDLPEE